MAQKIEVAPKILDARAEVRKKQLNDMGFSVHDVELADIYTFDTDFSDNDLERISNNLSNSVFQRTAETIKPKNKFDYVVEVGFLPGVTDNIGNTARESIEDSLDIKLDGQAVYSSQMMFLSGNISKEDAEVIGSIFANPVIQRSRIKSYDQFVKNNGMGVIVPRVDIKDIPSAGLVKILDMDDGELKIIGKAGIFDHNQELTKEEYENFKSGERFKEDGKYFRKIRRGPLALDLSYMKAIKGYFSKKGRNPTDLELESIAQTWSEHCKHTIFADPIDDIEEGLYRTFIKASTQKIREQKGDKDFCVSVFSDNSGVIKFDENHNICLKVETHNSPSALDPFGGSITGIVGVNRDPMGTGLGSKDFLNLSGPFCFANPDDKNPLYKGENFTQKMLSSRQIMNGVIDGVKVGGNCSGIPTSHFRMLFNQRYKGKPLVYVGTLGVMPNQSAGRPSHEKKANPEDLIIMVGGKVGKDGIHGATFSSEAMDSGSPVGAVQIGDPITQKKMSDALVKEARDLGLYTSITDNGAGGLSCSVAEMARESGGCYVNLDKVPLKYPGLQPWETWVSESQERMTLSVPAEKWNEFSNLMQRRGVEATVIGRFTDSGKCVVDYHGKDIMDVDMDFLHNGLPERPIKTTYTPKKHEEPDIPVLEDLTNTLHSMLRRQNITSIEFISNQYDHEVQGGSVIKPLQGSGRVNGDATITKPVLDSKKGVVVAQGINPSYSDIDTYDMAACAIDTAIRNAIAVGGNLEHIALLDNFCWCSSDEPERLGQLKRAVKACYDYSVGFGTPFVSGKDSMFNDFKGFDENGNPIKISVPPTLLVTSVGVMDDVRKAVSLDAKFAGDLVYVLGDTGDELGGSEYFSMKGDEEGKRYIGNKVPKVDLEKNKNLYQSLSKAIDNELVASAISVGIGGLGVALAKTAIGGRLGMEVNLAEVPIIHGSECSRDDYLLFSETQGRFVVTINPDYKQKFETIMMESDGWCEKIGRVRNDDQFVIERNLGTHESTSPINTTVNQLANSYKSTFKEY
jgi:phosphoribosylformylglycinamidine synthase